MSGPRTTIGRVHVHTARPPFSEGPDVPATPTADPTAIPPRPASTTVGIAMAWIGSVVLIYGGTTALLQQEDSKFFDDSVSAADRADQVAVAHSLGTLALIWAAVLISSALLVFLGYRWGGTVISVLAGFVVYWLVLSLVSSFALEGVTVTIWSVTSASLCRIRQPTREWFAAVREARSLKKQAG